MSTALIHIGVGKTGTTSIQHAFSGNHVHLGAVNYPKIGQGASHNHLTVLYRPYTSLSRGLKKFYADPDVRDQAQSQIREQFTSAIAKGGPLLLSGEFLSDMKQNEISALISDLTAGGYTKIGAICYVRAPAELYLSRLQQAVRGGTFFQQPVGARFKFLNILRRWQSETSTAPIVRAFARAGLVGGDVVQDFTQQAGRFFDCKLKIKKQTAPENESLSAEAMLLLLDFWNSAEAQQSGLSLNFQKTRLKAVQFASQELSSKLTKARLQPRFAQIIHQSHLSEIEGLSKNFNVHFRSPAGIAGDMNLPNAAGAEDSNEPSYSLREILESYNEDALEELRVVANARLAELERQQLTGPLAN